MRYPFVFALGVLFMPPMIAAQLKPWTVVRFPSDEPFSVKFVSPEPAGGCEKCDSDRPAGQNATGQAKITRDAEHVTIEAEISGLADEPGRYYLYIVNEKGGAKKIAAFGTAYN